MAEHQVGATGARLAPPPDISPLVTTADTPVDNLCPEASTMARIVITPETLYQDLDGETVLLHLGSETYFSLDEVGTRVWHLLVTHGDTETVVSHMLAEFDVEEATLRRDLEALIAELTAAGLITVEAQGMA